ncbi:hypothetical protein DNH61_01350 [Paenibacillus sambharensis]|uniref:DUF421 domain-containing protein n=1 Tax=Paenibacillus sambharensis TaxID=1803190 RepID=A0A2W1LFS4_9BACL|nr:DUF421 domain-containing protein [Paenibacillus sambharensis]PZD97549.1 hypothetical protein DNH61_01350 [Paenibacillus sambharensis]
MLDYIILVRALISFIFLFILTRLSGKKQLAQFSYFDYIVGITVGNFAASMVLEPETSLVDGLVAVTVWGTLPIFLSLMSRKHSVLLKLLESSPTVLIENGKFLTDGLIKENLTAQNVMLLLRKNGNFKLEDIELAVFETSGDLSILPRSSAAPVVVSDFNPMPMAAPRPRVLVVEGHILKDTLNELGLTTAWLEQEIKKQGADSVREVLVAQLKTDGTLYTEVWRGDLKDVKLIK